jgi:hypothetical protein
MTTVLNATFNNISVISWRKITDLSEVTDKPHNIIFCWMSLFEISLCNFSTFISSIYISYKINAKSICWILEVWKIMFNWSLIIQDRRKIPKSWRGRRSRYRMVVNYKEKSQTATFNKNSLSPQITAHKATIKRKLKQWYSTPQSIVHKATIKRKLKQWYSTPLSCWISLFELSLYCCFVYNALRCWISLFELSFYCCFVYNALRC